MLVRNNNIPLVLLAQVSKIKDNEYIMNKYMLNFVSAKYTYLL